MNIVKAKTTTHGNRQRGYMLLAVMLLITMMLLALTIVLPRVTQQIKREKEDELVHRGKEYAMAIKRYYHSKVSNGNYPTSLDQLDGTNNLRFLRKRFKDPMTVDGEWKLIHLGEAEIKFTGPTGGVPPGGPIGSLQTTPMAGSPSFTPTTSPGAPGPGGTATNPPSTGGQLGALATTTNPTQGAGFIIGVASKSKETSIKEFNGSNQYDEWLFVFDPRLECRQPAGVTPPVGAPVTSAAGATTTPASPCQGNGITIASPRSASTPPGNPPGPSPSVSPTPVLPNPSPSPTQQNPL
jgi:type II secretory pathway pseudopilin PulG